MSVLNQAMWLRVAAGLVSVLASGCATQAPVRTVPTQTTTPVTVQEPVQVEQAESAAMPVPPVQAEPVVVPVHVSLQEFVERNDDRLLQAYVGMSRLGIDRLMGGQRSGAYTNPFRQQSISLGDGKRYDVLYFLTRAPRAGHGITETMLTPVILRNDQVVAIGRFPLKKLRRGECPASKPVACQ